MFTSTANKGFQIVFPNEWMVSVQWGFNNYCAVRNCGLPGEEQILHCHNSNTAEVMIVSPAGEMEGEPKSWLSPMEVLAIMNEVSARP